MADNPVCHKAAVAAAGDAQLLGVYLGVFLQHFVGKGHDVAVIDGAVFAPQVGELVAPAVSAPGIAEEHKPALAGPVLHLVVEHLAVDGFGPAVDVQNGGIGLLGVKVLGAQHPAVQVDAVVCKGELLRQGHVGAGQGLLVEGSQLDALLGGLVPGVELLELHVLHADEVQRAAGRVDAVHRALLGVHRPDVPVFLQAEHLGGVADGGHKVELPILGHPLPAAAQAAVAAHRGAHGLLVGGQQGDFPGGGLQGVELHVLVHAVALVVRGQQQHLLPPPQGVVQAVGPGGQQLGRLPGGEVVPVHPRAQLPLGGVALPGEQQLRPVGAQVSGGHVEALLGEAGELAALLLKEEQGGAVLVHVPRAVEVEGQLVQHLVVLLLLLLRQQGLLGGGFHGVGLGEAQVPVHREQVDPLPHLLRQRGGQGHGKGQLRLAAADVQPVEGGKLLPGLQALLLLGVAARLEQQCVGAVPEKAAGFAVGSQLQGLSLRGFYPQIAAVGVFLHLRLGGNKGQLPLGAAPQPGEEGVVREGVYA